MIYFDNSATSRFKPKCVIEELVEIAFLQAELKKHKQKAKFLGYLHLVPTKCMFLHIHKRR